MHIDRALHAPRAVKVSNGSRDLEFAYKADVGARSTDEHVAHSRLQIIATDAIANAFTAYRDIPVVYLLEQPGETRGTAVTSVNLKFRPFEIKTIELVFS